MGKSPSSFVCTAYVSKKSNTLCKILPSALPWLLTMAALASSSRYCTVLGLHRLMERRMQLDITSFELSTQANRLVHHGIGTLPEGCPKGEHAAEEAAAEGAAAEGVAAPRARSVFDGCPRTGCESRLGSDCNTPGCLIEASM